MSLETLTESASLLDIPQGLTREVLIDASSGRKPKTVARLNDWHYVERSIHRLIAAWGRNFAAWDDKLTCHRQVWEQAECVRRLRERLMQFPGAVNNLDAPVSKRLETLVNTVLLAPSFEDAVDGIYSILGGALAASYIAYAQSAHPVHDAPTLALLHEILGLKEGQRLWLRDYRRRNPHTTDAEYRAAIERELQACGHFNAALPVEGEPAALAGVNTDFQLRRFAARPREWTPKTDVRSFLYADYKDSVEVRRLWWAVAYLQEISLPEDQLRWIYDGHYMPWDWHHDISRHLWDESRHGDSGHSRLLDFGITLEEIGLHSYDQPARDAMGSVEAVENAGGIPSLTPAELYEQVFYIGMIAETGHFAVKREAYDDFKTGGDLESSEMMLFDIIDESAHVLYAHKWLDLLAQHAGVDNSDYRERAQRLRRGETKGEESVQAAAEPVEPAPAPPPLRREMDNPDYAHFQQLLARMREIQPLSNAEGSAPRPLILS